MALITIAAHGLHLELDEAATLALAQPQHARVAFANGCNMIGESKQEGKTRDVVNLHGPARVYGAREMPLRA